MASKKTKSSKPTNLNKDATKKAVPAADVPETAAPGDVPQETNAKGKPPWHAAKKGGQAFRPRRSGPTEANRVWGQEAQRPGRRRQGARGNRYADELSGPDCRHGRQELLVLAQRQDSGVHLRRMQRLSSAQIKTKGKQAAFRKANRGQFVYQTPQAS